MIKNNDNGEHYFEINYDANFVYGETEGMTESVSGFILMTTTDTIDVVCVKNQNDEKAIKTRMDEASSGSPIAIYDKYPYLVLLMGTNNDNIANSIKKHINIE